MLCTTFLTDICWSLKKSKLMHYDRIHKQLLKLMQFICDNIKNDIFEINHNKFDVQSS